MLNIETFKSVLGETSASDEQLEVLLERVKRKAINHYWWKTDDNPTDEEIENFINRYEYEIYDLAETILDVASRNGLKQFSELGVTRVWGVDGDTAIENAINELPVKTYVY